MIKFKNIGRDIPSYPLSVINTLKYQDRNWLEKKEKMENVICHADSLKKKVSIRENYITIYKESHSKITEESIYSEEPTIFKLYQPNNGASKYMKQKMIELSGEIGKSIIIFKDFNTFLLIIDKPSGGKINIDTEYLNNTIT